MKFDLKHPAAWWLAVAVISMACTGLYAFMIVLSRAPGFNLLFTEQDFFRTALVTHVVLSLVIWFLAFILFLIYAVTSEKEGGNVDRIAAACALLGIFMIVATPLTGNAAPVPNNYVPTLNHPLYFAGLSIFFGFATVGVVLRAPVLLGALISGKTKLPLIVIGSLCASGLSIVVGIACMAIAKWMLSTQLVADTNPRYYFELLFWGGGHVLQFANTFGMMAGWALITKRLTGEEIVTDKVAGAILLIMTGFVLIAPTQYFINPVSSYEHRHFFTLLKGWGISIGPIVLGIAAIKLRKKMKADPVARQGLYLSIMLFAMGGTIALTIQGSDTRVPAHYHGVIGGVTICYMTIGLTSMLDNGWFSSSSKWLKRQVTLYGVGQAVFVVGMFTGGTLGLARKTYGQAQVLDTIEKVFSMGVMGIGGFMAIAGGELFVILMAIALIHAYKKMETGG